MIHKNMEEKNEGHFLHLFPLIDGSRITYNQEH
jgi:hypothetical protein